MVIFERIRYRNFLATGNIFTELVLDDSPSTIISGKNGAGKSTFLDALTFVLFGRPFRPINKPNLVNSINQRDCLVEVEFRIGTKKYKVVRGIKPNIFEIYCDSILINQDAKAKDYQDYLEKIILKMNFKSFTQIVVLGSATFVPFMQLPAADRRAIIEDLLDIQVFSSMNVLLKQKLLSIREQQNDIKHDQDMLVVKIESSEKLMKELHSNNEARKAQLELELGNLDKEVDENQELIDAVGFHIGKLYKEISDEDKVRRHSTKLLAVETKLETTKKKLEKDLAFYEENQNCPICQQSIDEQFKTDKIETRKKKLGELVIALAEVEQEISKVNTRLIDINKVQDEIRSHDASVTRFTTVISEANKRGLKIAQELGRMGDDPENITDEQININEMRELDKALLKDNEKLITEKHYYDIAGNLLKDTGIKTKIIRQYLPIINKLINKYLVDMDFFVNFALDEGFNESIKSRFRDEFSYGNFSEGEKKRINLAIMFTWREVAKLKNSVSTNLLVMDEILDSSLDFSGTDILVTILNSFDDRTNVFIISHKSDIMTDKFKATVKFEKHGNFSRIV